MFSMFARTVGRHKMQAPTGQRMSDRSATFLACDGLLILRPI